MTVATEGPGTSKCNEPHRGLAVATLAGLAQLEEAWNVPVTGGGVRHRHTRHTRPISLQVSPVPQW